MSHTSQIRTGFRSARVGVVLGGASAEREVSLNTGRACAEALRDAGYDVVEIEWRPGRGAAGILGGVDVVFLALHGAYGEDGSIQGLLNCLELPYTGAGVQASALAMDKVASKRLFAESGVPTPAYRVLPSDGAGLEIAAAKVDYPCVVKPAREGSSVGVSIAHDAAQLAAGFKAARRANDEVLVEQFVAGVECSVGIFDGQVLGSVQIVPAEGFYDYEAKYESENTQYLLPPQLSESLIAEIERDALAAYEVLSCRGVARVDVMIDDGGGIFVLEVNTVPGMTATSLVPKLAAARGETFPAFVARMLESATFDKVSDDTSGEAE